MPQWPQRHLRAATRPLVQPISFRMVPVISGGVEEFAFPFSGLSNHGVTGVALNRYAEEASSFP